MQVIHYFAMAWSYYDFDKNWKRFFEVWSSTKVQTVLCSQMNDWCSGTAMSWHTNEPLWQLSRHEYWSRENKERLRNYVAATYGPHGHVHHSDAMRRAANIEISQGAWDALLQERFYEESLPQPGTLDSLVLVDGEEYLHDALLETATALFPESGIFSVDPQGASYVVVPNEHLVLDLLGFYWYTREGDRSCSPRAFDDLFRPINFEVPYQYRIY